MPGATDEFYMFRRAKALLTVDKPSLLDAIEALTKQTFIRISFRAPLCCSIRMRIPLKPEIYPEHEPTVKKVKQNLFPNHVVYNDRDWDYIQPILKKVFRVDVRPWRRSYDSWHFIDIALPGGT